MNDHTHSHGDHQHGDGEPAAYTGNFDEMAKTWDDDPMKVERARVVAELIVERLNPTSATRLLEYGAGTGLVAQHLQDNVGPITMAEPSAGMRDAIAAKIAGGDLPPEARVWPTDLAVDAPPSPDERFDLIATVQVMHHVAAIETVLTAFAGLLEPGGHLCIVDLEAEDGSFHGDGFGGHHGFHRAELGAQLQAAGFAEVTFEHAYDLHKDGHDYPLFLAIATR